MRFNDTYFPKTSMFKKEILERGDDYFKSRYNIIDITDFINQSFQDEYAYYLKNKEYYAGCALKTYKKLYKSRLKIFLVNYPYADEFDFIREELTIIKRIAFHEEYYNFFDDLYRKPYIYNFRLSCELTREFLFTKVLKELGGKLELSEKYYEIYHLPDTPAELKEASFWNFLPKRPSLPYTSVEEKPKKDKNSNNSRSQKQMTDLHLREEYAKILYLELRRSEILCEEVREDEFIQLFSKNKNGRIQEIRIDSETAEFAFLLQVLRNQKQFENFTEKNIGESKLFLSKNGKVITYDSLRSSRHSAKKAGSLQIKKEGMTKIVTRISQRISQLSN